MFASHLLQGLSAHEERQIAFAFPILDPSFTEQPALAIYFSLSKAGKTISPPAGGKRGKPSGCGFAFVHLTGVPSLSIAERCFEAKAGPRGRLI
jgi:hypothetical protein